jgi:hypothetical protein
MEFEMNNVKKIADSIFKSAQQQPNITDFKSFENYFKSLGLTVENIRQSKLSKDGIAGTLEGPLDLSKFSYLGTPRKEKIKGKTNYIFSIKGKGELRIADFTTVSYVTFIKVEGAKCTVQELISFVKSFGVPAKKGRLDVAGGTTTVLVGIKNDDAKELLEKIETKFKVTLKDGFGTAGKDNYMWSDYRFTHPEYGSMSLFIDRRPSNYSKIMVFGTKV